jgi:pimeloyl-ACP methyl ester carboxylesterase
VYVPDRRGRGLSGPPGDHYGLGAECEDVAALAQVTGARSLFGLSLGAIIALQAALVLPMIRRVAVYERRCRSITRHQRTGYRGMIGRLPRASWTRPKPRTCRVYSRDTQIRA